MKNERRKSWLSLVDATSSHLAAESFRSSAPSHQVAKCVALQILFYVLFKMMRG